MPDSDKPKRAYNSTRRQAQARQTRQQIAEAARVLFTERGYSGTTIEAIAQQAGVAPETIYSIFRSKHRVLWYLFDTAVGGDEEPVPIIERPGPQAILHETDQRRQITMFARGIATVMGRAAPVFDMLRSAAETEPEIAALVQRLTDERWHNMGVVLGAITANGPLRDGLDSESAVAAVWTLASPQVCLLLMRDRGWGEDQYAAWLAESLIRLLLP
jgi:AcrR family transcriptional regulator